MMFLIRNENRRPKTRGSYWCFCQQDEGQNKQLTDASLKFITGEYYHEQWIPDVVLSGKGIRILTIMNVDIMFKCKIGGMFIILFYFFFFSIFS